MNTSLTPQFFDALVIAVIVVGLVLAAFRIRGDFKKGPIWPEDNAPGAPRSSGATPTRSTPASTAKNARSTQTRRVTQQQEPKEKKS